MKSDVDSRLDRRNLYLFFSLLFSDPHEPQFEQLRDPENREAIAGSIHRAIDHTSSVAPAGPDERIEPGVDIEDLLRQTDDLEAVREEYLDVFGLTMPKDCPPYEVEYCEKTDLFYRSQLLADIGGFYQAFGLQRSDESPDREDHLRTEFEFLHFLFSKWLYGEEQGHNEENLERVRDAARTFFEEHVGWWVGAFGREVENHQDADFYRDAARLLRWFVRCERLEFGLPVTEERPEPNVPDVDPAGTCFECNLGPSAGDDSFQPPT